MYYMCVCVLSAYFSWCFYGEALGTLGGEQVLFMLVILPGRSASSTDSTCIAGDPGGSMPRNGGHAVEKRLRQAEPGRLRCLLGSS